MDLVYIMAVLLVFSVFLIIGAKFMDGLKTGLSSAGVLDARGTQAINNLDSMYGSSIDQGFLFLMVGLCIAALIMAMMVAIHPVFFFFYLILLTIVIFLGGVFSNIYQEMATHPEMTAVATKLVYTSHIMEYLPMIIGVIGFILAMVMYRTYQNAA